MAYSTDKLTLIAAAHGPTGNNVWLYAPVAGGTQTDAVATVRGAGYISDAVLRGMKVNDVVICMDTSTPLTSFSRVSVVASTGATLTA